MKLIIKISLILVLFSCTSSKKISNNTSPKIKKITTAYPSFSSYEINRETALNEKISQIFFYNPTGAIIETHTYSADSISFLSKKEIISLDKNDKPIKGEVYNEKGVLLEYWISKLDKKGNMIEKAIYDNKNVLTGKYTFSFDSSGNEIENSKLNHNDVINYRNESTYNSKNQLVQYRQYSDNVIGVRNLAYDKKGNRIEQIHILNNDTIRHNYQYNKRNELIFTKIFHTKDKRLSEIIHEYVFDEFGNWITQRSIFDKKIYWFMKGT